MRFLLPLLLLALASPAEARLSREEQAVAATVAREADRHVALLERLVNQNSGTLNLRGVRAVADMIRARIGGDRASRSAGSTWPRPAAPAISSPPPRAARRGGAIRRHILLIGHLDTVFEP